MLMKMAICHFSKPYWRSIARQDTKLWQASPSHSSIIAIPGRMCLLSINFSRNDTHIQVHALSKTAALDVDTENEYKAMVGKILAEKLKNVTILVDMKDIQKACSVQVSV